MQIFFFEVSNLCSCAPLRVVISRGGKEDRSNVIMPALTPELGITFIYQRSFSGALEVSSRLECSFIVRDSVYITPLQARDLG